MLAPLLLVALVGADTMIDSHVARECAGPSSDKAVSACSRVIEELPHSAKDRAIAYLFRGRAFNAKHQPELAVSDFTKAIAIDPRLAPAFSERASAYIALQRVDLAISDCTEATVINPTNAIYPTGNAYWRAKQLDKALGEYGDAIRLQPDFPLVYMNRGLVEAEQGTMDAAVRDLTEAIQLDPSSTDALYNRGLMYGRMGQLADAIDDFTAVIRANPNEADAYKVRAEAQQELGHPDEAIKDLRRAAELDPSDAESSAALRGLLEAR
jgi:tetratricopeptide (TPR) repeat protein